MQSVRQPDPRQRVEERPDERPAISMFLPAHNEAANIEQAMDEALAVLARIASRFELIVVDDGSRDGTADRVLARAHREPRVRLVRHPVNRGYGGALISGFAACRLDWVFFTDADNQFDLSELAALVERRAEADLVIGYRHPRRDPLMRLMFGRGWRWLIRVALGLDVRDVDCAFKLIRRRVLEEIELTSSGAVISAELLVKAHQAGFRSIEVPVTHRPRRTGRSSGGRPSVIARALRELWALRQRLSGPGR